MTGSTYQEVKALVLRRIEAGEISPNGDRARVRAAIAECVHHYQERAHLEDDLTPISDVEHMIDRLLASVADLGPLTELIGRSDVEEIQLQGAQVTYWTSDGRVRADRQRGRAAPVRRAAAAGLGRPRTARRVHPDRQRGHRRRGAAVGQDRPGRRRAHRQRPPAGRPASHLGPARRGRHAHFRCGRVVVRVDADPLADTGRRPSRSGQDHAGQRLAGRGARRLCGAGQRGDPRAGGRGHPRRLRPRGRPARADAAGLVKADLRFRPDLLVVGEVRGGEAFELLRPLNAGVGLVTTVHANEAGDAVDALAVAAELAGERINAETIRRLFARHVEFVVFVDVDETRASTEPGKRRQVTEICWVEPELRAGHVVHEPLFAREEFGLPLEWTGAAPPPTVARRIERGLARWGGEPVALKAVLAGERLIVGGASTNGGRR